MFSTFFSYFTSYIFKAKTRQRLLFLAVVGLFLSSFALIFLQSTMGGLQHKLMDRSKKVTGHGVMLLDGFSEKEARELNEILRSKGHSSFIEYEIELLLRAGKQIAPISLHGFEQNGPRPEFLKDVSLEGLTLPGDLAHRMNIIEGDQVHLISPGHVDSLFGDIPRQISNYVDDIISTNVPEVDMIYAWAKLKSIQNLVRALNVNRVRFFSPVEKEEVLNLVPQKWKASVRFLSWEEQNSSLVWALRLETTVMVFLFVAMTMLVSLCITSGLMIFFDKVKIDLASFWILGASKDSLEKASLKFLFIMSFTAVVAGILVGFVGLFILDQYGFEIMPDVFVDRKIPVHITLRGVLISFFVPFTISIVFSLLTLSQFKKESDYLEHVRVIG